MYGHSVVNLEWSLEGCVHSVVNLAQEGELGVNPRKLQVRRDPKSRVMWGQNKVKMTNSEKVERGEKVRAVNVVSVEQGPRHA